MRTIEYAAQFKRDYRRVKRNPRYRKLDDWLRPLLEGLAADLDFTDPPIRDHELSGTWASYRELHIRPDLLLIYSKSENQVLRLVRLGSHSELFG